MTTTAPTTGTAPVYVTRDGKYVATLDNQNDALSWFHRHCSQSMSYELEHGGYAVTTEPPARDGLNGYKVLTVEDVPIGRVSGAAYGYKRDLLVTVSVRMEHIPTEHQTVDHKPIRDYVDFAMVTAVWRPDRRDITGSSPAAGALTEVLEHGRYEDGWDADKVRELIELASWHLNGMNAECAHMDTATLVREPDRYNPAGRIACGKANTCPASGYTYGSAWLVKPLPAGFLNRVRKLFPDA